MKPEPSVSEARRLDRRDPLASFRKEFLIPKSRSGKPWIYLAGNSLGLQPRKARAYVAQELEDWARLGVDGHFEAKHPWMSYHETVGAPMARVVGALPTEVVVMNTLTVNLHLMMVSFYRPTSERRKILVEAGAFPSDQYAVASQARFHGYDPATTIVQLRPRAGESSLRTEDILEVIEREGRQLALVMLGSVNYLTGQAFDIPRIVEAGHRQGCRVGFDLAHAAGNLELRLHDWGPDFAVWCSYKYLNAGPGNLSGCFVHERHARALDLPRFAGWWGHDKVTRFQMGDQFRPMPGAEGWQLSNPPIFELAALRASLELFDRATLPRLRKKSELLTGYLERLLDTLPPGFCQVTTPSDAAQRGCQLSLRVNAGSGGPRGLLRKLARAGIICDFREPDTIRAAPVPLYNRFEDVWHFVETLRRHAP